jgi:hypothetical protein
MLRVVIKGRRYGSTTKGRNDGYQGPFEAATSKSYEKNWVTADVNKLGMAVPFDDPNIVEDLADNSQSVRGNHLQAFEYSREGPSAYASEATIDVTKGLTVNGGGDLAGTAGISATTTMDLTKKFIGNFFNDGYVAAPGSRVCGIYIDPTKLHRGQIAKEVTSGIGPLPPYGGISKNWYKLAYIRRFRGGLCKSGATNSQGHEVRPGMGS